MENSERTKKLAELNRRRAFIKEHYSPLHAEMFDKNTFNEEDFFTPEFLKVGKALRASRNDTTFDSFFLQEAKGIFSFDIFKLSFCRKLIEEALHFHDSELPRVRPNSMNNYGLVWEEFLLMQPLLDRMLQRYLKPIIRHLFDPDLAESLSEHHTFMVEYRVGGDLLLNEHTDDSQVTLNVCLGTNFTGGELEVKGILGSADEDTIMTVYNQVPGRGVLHVGDQKHSARRLTSGERFNFIMWMGASDWIEEHFYRYYVTYLTDLQNTPWFTMCDNKNV